MTDVEYNFIIHLNSHEKINFHVTICVTDVENTFTLTHAKGIAMLSMEAHFFMEAHLWDWLVDRSLLVYLLQPQTISQNSPQAFLQPFHKQEGKQSFVLSHK